MLIGVLNRESKLHSRWSFLVRNNSPLVWNQLPMLHTYPPWSRPRCLQSPVWRKDVTGEKLPSDKFLTRVLPWLAGLYIN